MVSNFFIFILLFLVSCKSIDLKENIIILGLIGLILILFCISFIIFSFRVKRIRNIYKSTKFQLHFWDKLDRKKLESMLEKNRLPKNWVFRLNSDNTKIEDIYFNQGMFVGRIAQDKEKLFTSLRKRLNKD